MSEWEPKIVAFLCNWCSYGAADLAGVGRCAARVVRQRVTPQLLAALVHGAGHAVVAVDRTPRLAGAGVAGAILAADR